MIQLEISDWMKFWGWRRTETLGKVIWEKVSPGGLIIGQQGDATWERDCQEAWRYEKQLMETVKQ